MKRSNAVIAWGLGLALGFAASSAVAEDAEPATHGNAPAWEDLEVIPLRDAGKQRLVTARGVKPRGYRQVDLELSNDTEVRLAIDIAGSSLEPYGGTPCQRLGLGPSVAKGDTTTRDPGTVIVHLEPGEKRSLRVNTVCLDSRRAVPSSQEFKLATRPLPPVRQKVLRWWAEHPGAPQGCVNSAIWSNRAQVILPKNVNEKGVRRRHVSKRSAALHGDVYYQLKDGELTSLDRDGVRRFLGTEILDVFPTEQAVYAVALASASRRALYRLSMTGTDPWALVTHLGEQPDLSRVIPVRGGILLVSSKGVHRFDAATKESKLLLGAEQSSDVTWRRKPNGGLTLALKVPYEKGIERAGGRSGEKAPYQMIWDLDPAGREKTLVRRSWNIRQSAAGPAGIFALSHKGRLRKMQRKTFKEFGRAAGFRTIVAVGKTTLWLVDRDQRLVAVSAKSGKRLHRSRRPAPRTGIAHDPVTDDVAYLSGTDFARRSAKDGKVSEIPQTEDVTEER